MKLSKLQKYILRTSSQNSKTKMSRDIFYKFYDSEKKVPAKKIQANIVTKSIERLIDKGLLIGFGEKTQYKLFITHIQLTTLGKKTAQTLFGKQSKLPLRIKKK